jgi:hypothetical protein
MMANRRAAFTKSDVKKVLSAYRDVGEPMPQIVIEEGRLTVLPMTDANRVADPNPWDRP